MRHARMRPLLLAQYSPLNRFAYMSDEGGREESKNERKRRGREKKKSTHLRTTICYNNSVGMHVHVFDLHSLSIISRADDIVSCQMTRIQSYISHASMWTLTTRLQAIPGHFKSTKLFPFDDHLAPLVSMFEILHRTTFSWQPWNACKPPPPRISIWREEKRKKKINLIDIAA